MYSLWTPYNEFITRRHLSEAAVLAAARRVVDAGGLTALSMRRLARELGVAPNALYTYFPTKDALVDGLLDSLLASVGGPRGGSWEDRVVGLMRASRAAVLKHPELMPLFFSRQLTGPNALRLGEETLSLFAEGGVKGKAAARTLRALLVFTFGFAAFEAPRAAGPDRDSRLERARKRWEAGDPAAFPHSRRIISQLAKHPSQRDFELGIRALIAGLGDSAA